MDEQAISSARIASVIVTYNRRSVLQRALNAVLEQTRPLDAIVVVDNASQDGTHTMIRELFPQANYIRLNDNLGYAAGLAAGMRHAIADGAAFTWLMDDDSVPVSTALERLLALSATVERCGVVGLDGGSLRHGSPASMARLKRVEAVTDTAAYHAHFVLVDGALVRVDAVNEVGLPREDFFMMMEDIEYTSRIRRAGWEVICLDEELIDRGHLGSGGAVAGGTSPPWRGYYQSRNHLAIALEHRSPVEVGAWMRRQSRLIAGTALKGDRRWRRVSYRLRGGIDAIRGNMGRTIDPSDG